MATSSAAVPSRSIALSPCRGVVGLAGSRARRYQCASRRLHAATRLLAYLLLYRTFWLALGCRCARSALPWFGLGGRRNGGRASVRFFDSSISLSVDIPPGGFSGLSRGQWRQFHFRLLFSLNKSSTLCKTKTRSRSEVDGECGESTQESDAFSSAARLSLRHGLVQEGLEEGDDGGCPHAPKGISAPC